MQSNGCALVSQGRAAAAGAAPGATTLELKDCVDAASLQRWLHKHGQGLENLHIHRSSGLLSQLPCLHLQSLLLQECCLYLGPGSSLLQDLSAASRLTSLRASQVSCYGAAGSPDILLALTAATGLQELSLQHLVDLQTDGHNQPLQAPPGLLQHCRLPQLTRLELAGELLSADAVLGPLPGLSTLQHLQLQGWCWATQDALAAVQELRGLTCLQLLDAGWSLWLGDAPWFTALTSLQHLQLSYEPSSGCIKPAVLSGLTQLQHLRLCNVNVQQDIMQPHLSAVMDPGPDPDAVQELLGVLEGMAQLTQLELQRIDSLAGAPLQAYSALTASSTLRRLELSPACLGVKDDNPAQLWRHVFPPRLPSPQDQQQQWHQQQQHLTSLMLTYAVPAFDSDSLAALCCCCPALQQLDLQGSLPPCDPPVQLTALSLLPALTHLTLSGVSDDSSSVGALARLTGLLQLRLMATNSLTDLGLQQLTRLVQLQQLGLELVGLQLSRCLQGVLLRCCRDTVTPEGTSYQQLVASSPQEGSGPDVWSQLAAACNQATQQQQTEQQQQQQQSQQTEQQQQQQRQQQQQQSTP